MWENVGEPLESANGSTIVIRLTNMYRFEGTKAIIFAQVTVEGEVGF